MTLRKLLAAAPVIGVLALAGPVASAGAQTSVAAPPPSAIPCYPYPAFCGPNGQPWLSAFFPSSLPSLFGGLTIQPLQGFPFSLAPLTGQTP